MKSQPNPSDRDIDAAYERLQDASLNELSRLIPRWTLRACGSACECETLVLRSADHPNAVILAAGLTLAKRLGVPSDMVSWQVLNLES